MMGLRDSASGDFNVAAVVTLLGTDVVRVSGRLDRRLKSLSALSAPDPEALTFCRHSDERLDAALRSRAGAIIVSAVRQVEAAADGPALIAVKNPRLSFIRVSRQLFPHRVSAGVHRTAIVDPTASVHATAEVGPFAIVGPRCSVGAGSVLGAHVVLQQDVRIGAGCRIDTGTVIGSEGFGFERDDDGKLVNFPHVGGVIVGDNVDIGCNSCIDRGTLEDTVIGDGARIDNLTHISHNCRIGAHAVVICQVTLCGSTVVGDYAWISPSASILNQRTIGARAVVGMGAVVVKDVPDGVVVAGNPARVLGSK